MTEKSPIRNNIITQRQWNKFEMLKQKKRKKMKMGNWILKYLKQNLTKKR